MKDVLRFANQILDMEEEIINLRRENTRLLKYEHMYNELLNESVRHGEKMMVNTLNLLMTPGVTEALQKSSSHGA